jgi:hypothetical protein
MKHPFLFLAGSLLLAGTAQAQTTLSIGPRVGFVRSTASGADSQYELAARSGVEVGLMGTLQRGHFAFQSAVLYSQQGFVRNQRPLGGGYTLATATTRLNYLSIPLQFAYTQHTNGQGLQFFAGPYLGLLLGGRNAWDYPSNPATGKVVVTDIHTVYGSTGGYTVRYPDYNFYARSVDLGGQVGLGYRLGGALLQVSYSQGLRRVNSFEQYSVGGITSDVDSPNYRNRSFQVSLSYLFG